MHSDAATVNPRDVLIDESKQADIENLGDCLRVLGDGPALGDFSLTIILYADDKKTLDRVLPDVVRIFTSADGSLFSETYNQLNAYFATVPGNYNHNLRKLFLLNSNYADISFLFTVHPGETWNEHLDRDTQTFFGLICSRSTSGKNRALISTRNIEHTRTYRTAWPRGLKLINSAVNAANQP